MQVFSVHLPRFARGCQSEHETYCLNRPKKTSGRLRPKLSHSASTQSWMGNGKLTGSYYPMFQMVNAQNPFLCISHHCKFSPYCIICRSIAGAIKTKPNNEDPKNLWKKGKHSCNMKHSNLKPPARPIPSQVLRHFNKMIGCNWAANVDNHLRSTQNWMLSQRPRYRHWFDRYADDWNRWQTFKRLKLNSARWNWVELDTTWGRIPRRCCTGYCNIGFCFAVKFKKISVISCRSSMSDFTA